jgi:hypothetical protein
MDNFFNRIFKRSKKQNLEAANKTSEVDLKGETSKPEDGEEISEKEQEVLKLILKYIERSQNIPETYLSDKYKNILQKALEQGIFDRISRGWDIPQKYIFLLSEETLNKIKTSPEYQEKIAQVIVDFISIGLDIWQQYISFLSEETLNKIKTNPEYQEKVRQGIVYLISRGLEIWERCIYLASEKTLNKIKKNPEYQQKIKQRIFYCISEGLSIPQQYISLASQETLQKALELGIVYYILRRRDIPQKYISLLSEETLNKIKTSPEYQQKIEQGIAYFILSGVGIPQQYISLASQETLQKALEKGIIYYILKGWDTPQQYISLASQETLQKALEQGIINLILKVRDISQQYISLLSEETLNKIKTNPEYQQKIEQGIAYRISKGLDISKYLIFVPKDKNQIIKELKENTESLKKVLRYSIESFFSDASQLNQEINEQIEKLTNEEIQEAVFGKTILPIGIKIHTVNNPLLAESLWKTGGFIAHGQETAFIANPVSNTKIVQIAINALKNKLQKQGYNPNLLEKDSYFQVCVPHRLSNESCGIATIAYLLARNDIFQYNEDLIRSNQNTIGLTIYDAGGVLIRDFFVPTKDRGAKPEFRGRTDMLLCKSQEDIELAHFLLSFLVHAEYQETPLYFQDLAKEFISEFKQILQKHKKEHWLSNKFVAISEEETQSIESLGSVLMEITNIRNELDEKIENNNETYWIYETIRNVFALFDDFLKDRKLKNFFNLLNQLKEKTKDNKELNDKINKLMQGFKSLNQFYQQNNEYLYNLTRKSLENLQQEIENILRQKLYEFKRQIQNNLYYDVKDLIEKYKSLVYPDGKLIDMSRFV